MSEVFFQELGMAKPSVHLGVGSAKHGAQTGRMLEAIEAEMLVRRPDVALIYGDTNSTLAGALAAAKLGIRIAHVEAGLRSFNMSMPEEVNRVVADRLSTFLFTPSADADANLAKEGFDKRRISQVGDVMFDALRYESELAPTLVLTQHGLVPSKYVLATIHRAENTDDLDRLKNIADALEMLAEQMPVILPLHPRTRIALDRLEYSFRRVTLITPVGYRDMCALERSANMIFTDSGGVQKEAFWHGVPCVTCRDETEWTELVASGWNTLSSPTDSRSLYEDAKRAIAQDRTLPRPALYGDARAGEKIGAALAAL
jgi:UDP-GlcNAc3NAcA epimerase